MYAVSLDILQQLPLFVKRKTKNYFPIGSASPATVLHQQMPAVQRQNRCCRQPPAATTMYPCQWRQTGSP